MLENINTFLSGIIVGMIIFQSSVIAPTIFSTLDEKNAGKIIRNIFPKLFKIILEGECLNQSLDKNLLKIL